MSGVTKSADDSALAPIVRDPANRYKAGRFMQILGVAGLVTALVGTIVGWQLVGQVDETVQNSLALTSEALVSLEDTIVVANEVVDSVDASLEATQRTLDTVQGSFGEAELVVEEVDTVLASVAGNVDTAAQTVEDLASIGSTIDRVLGQLDSIPFGPDYNPSAPLGAQLQQLADELAPIGDSLDTTSTRLGDFVESTRQLEQDLLALSESVGQIKEDLAASSALLSEYRDTAFEARTLTDDARSELDADVRNTRLLILFGGILVALGQIVPFWVGTELTVAAREATSPFPE